MLITGGLEVILPVPFVEDDRQFRPVAFFDFGNVFNTDCPRTSSRCYGPSLDDMRYSLGIGVTWLVALAPIFRYCAGFQRRYGRPNSVFPV